MTYEVKVEADENGEPIIVFPEEIIAKYNLEEGDDVPYEIKDGFLVLHLDQVKKKCDCPTQCDNCDCK